MAGRRTNPPGGRRGKRLAVEPNPPAGGPPGRPAASDGAVRHIEFDIVYDPVDEDPPMPPPLKAQFQELFDLVMDVPAEAIDRLEPLVRQWPDVPQLANLLMVANARAGRREEAERLTEDSFVRFPDYLFARINFARLVLDRGHVDAVVPAMGGDFDLTRIYPGRTQFHYSEVVGLYALMGSYLLATGEPDRAGLCLELLEEIAPDHPATAALENRLMFASVEEITRRLMKGGPQRRPRRRPGRAKPKATKAKPKAGRKKKGPGDLGTA